MAANKAAERFATFTMAMPSGINIASGQPLMLGEKYTVAMVAQEAQNTTNPPYDPNSGYLSVDMEGAYNLSVEGFVSPSPSAGANIKIGDPVFASGGTYDPLTGITYGFTLSADTAGDLFGIALQAVVAGTTAIIPVLLKNCVGLRF